VTDMSDMFDGAKKFNQNISSWDVSKVTNMSNMFSNSTFNQDISTWDVSNVKDMSNMFFKSEFNQDLSNWDVSNVKNMRRMFYKSAFKGDISSWKLNAKVDVTDFGMSIQLSAGTRKLKFR